MEGEAVCVDLPDARHGALVESAEIEQTFYGPFAVIKYKFCAFDGKKFVWMRHSRRIPAYEGERSGKQLGLWPLSAAEKTQFLAEGKRYAQHTKTPSYLHYTGALRIRGY